MSPAFFALTIGAFAVSNVHPGAGAGGWGHAMHHAGG